MPSSEGGDEDPGRRSGLCVVRGDGTCDVCVGLAPGERAVTTGVSVSVQRLAQLIRGNARLPPGS